MRFELVPNGRDGWDIVDHNQETLTIYNDLGDTYSSSAPQLCDLLNKLYDENINLKNALWEAEVNYYGERCDNVLDYEGWIEDLKTDWDKEYWNDK